MSKTLRYITVFILFMALAAVRFFERELFYDPLIAYFDTGYLDGKFLPEMDFFYFFLSVTFRYWLNCGISLLLIYLLFLEASMVKFSLLFYGCSFVVLMLLYAALISGFDPEHYLRLFYVRRLLIQPVFIILLLPAFYYQKRRGN